jgi:hypothetical protein
VRLKRRLKWVLYHRTIPHAIRIDQIASYTPASLLNLEVDEPAVLDEKKIKIAGRPRMDFVFSRWNRAQNPEDCSKAG